MQSVILKRAGYVPSCKIPIGVVVCLFLLQWFRESWQGGAEEGGEASLF